MKIIKTVDDMMALDDGEFIRMLPDLAAFRIAYHEARKHPVFANCEITFQWKDDGESGVISGVDIQAKAKGGAA